MTGVCAVSQRAQCWPMILEKTKGGDAKFASSFRQLGAKLFSPYGFRDLPANHLIFTAQQFPAAA